AAARKVLMRGDDCDDVVSEALVRLIDKIELLKTLDCYTQKAYVVSAVRNTAINWIIRRDRRAKHAFLADDDAFCRLPSGDDGPDDCLMRLEDQEAVKRAVRRLSERDRLALTMKYFDELPDAVIARTLGVGVSSVRPLLMRARRRMREAIEA
ncbi:MAG: sigma-70 family RNA polymerase sigma factor, partial [Clostridiales bacterium]|nr:sigma-70 family RNA polymerase sigma factor [Clostridiales bacterium]